MLGCQPPAGQGWKRRAESPTHICEVCREEQVQAGPPAARTLAPASPPPAASPYAALGAGTGTGGNGDGNAEVGTAPFFSLFMADDHTLVSSASLGAAQLHASFLVPACHL